jgi:hypothetical protein
MKRDEGSFAPERLVSPERLFATDDAAWWATLT